MATFVNFGSNAAVAFLLPSLEVLQFLFLAIFLLFWEIFMIVLLPISEICFYFCLSVCLFVYTF